MAADHGQLFGWLQVPATNNTAPKTGGDGREAGRHSYHRRTNSNDSQHEGAECDAQARRFRNRIIAGFASFRLRLSTLQRYSSTCRRLLNECATNRPAVGTWPFCLPLVVANVVKNLHVLEQGSLDAFLTNRVFSSENNCKFVRLCPAEFYRCSPPPLMKTRLHQHMRKSLHQFV